MGAVSRPSSALRVPRRVLEQLAAPRGPAAPAVPEPVSAEEAAAAARMQAMWEQLAHTGQQGQQTTKAPPAAASPALTAAVAARARVQAMMQRQSGAGGRTSKAASAPPPPPPAAELRVQDADVVIKGQSLPIQWLLQELDQLVTQAANAGVDAGSPDAQRQRLQRCDEILTELYAMVYPAPAHPANALSLDDYSCILRAVALDTQRAHKSDNEATDALDGVIAPVQPPPSSSSEAEAAEAAGATAAVELYTHTLPFVRLLLFQVESARPESLRDATIQSAELRRYIEQHQLDRPLLRLPRTTLLDIVQRATTMGSTNPRAAASSTATAVADLLRRSIGHREREVATAVVDADRPWQELLPQAFAPGPAPPVSSPDQTSATPAAAAATAAAFDDGSGGFDVQHVLGQLNHLHRVQRQLKKQAVREAEMQISSVHNTRMQLQHMCTRGSQLLQDLHGALVSGAGAHISLPDLERVLTIHVPQMQAYHLALPLFEQLLQQQQSAYDTARASRTAAKSIGNRDAAALRTRIRALPLPQPIPVRVTDSVMACIPLASPHSPQDALRLHKAMNALSPRSLCTYDAQAANRLLRSYALNLQSSAVDDPSSLAARGAMFKEVKMLHHSMRLRNATSHTLLLQSMAWLARPTALVQAFDFMRTDSGFQLDRYAYALYAEALLALLSPSAHPTGDRNELDESALRTRADRVWEAACQAMLMTSRFVSSLARFWHTVGDAPRLIRVVCTAHELQTKHRPLVDAELLALALAAAVREAPEAIDADVQRLRALIQSLDIETQTQLQARTPTNVAHFIGQTGEPPAVKADTDAGAVAIDINSGRADSQPAVHSV